MSSAGKSENIGLLNNGNADDEEEKKLLQQAIAMSCQPLMQVSSSVVDSSVSPVVQSTPVSVARGLSRNYNADDVDPDLQKAIASSLKKQQRSQLLKEQKLSDPVLDEPSLMQRLMRYVLPYRSPNFKR